MFANVPDRRGLAARASSSILGEAEVDHQLIGQPLQVGPHGRDVHAGRHRELGVDLEEHAPGHGRVADVGGEPVDADAVRGERGRDLGEDARTVLAEQVQAAQTHLALGRPGRRLLVTGDGDLEAALPQPREACLQRGDRLRRHVDEHHAGELAGQPGQLAALPAAAARLDRAGDGRDQAGAVVADEGEHEGDHGGTLAGRAGRWSS